MVGATWKQGQWTKEEVDILQNNINRYCEVNFYYIIGITTMKFYWVREKLKILKRTAILMYNMHAFLEPGKTEKNLIKCV